VVKCSAAEMCVPCGSVATTASGFSELHMSVFRLSVKTQNNIFHQQILRKTNTTIIVTRATNFRVQRIKRFCPKKNEKKAE